MTFNKIQHLFVMKNTVDLVRGAQHLPTPWKFGTLLKLASDTWVPVHQLAPEQPRGELLGSIEKICL